MYSPSDPREMISCRPPEREDGDAAAVRPAVDGLNVVFASRQLGHANPKITLQVYAHLFAQADHAATAREALETSYAANEQPRSVAVGRRIREPVRGARGPLVVLLDLSRGI